jgi:hypothetical protein
MMLQWHQQQWCHWSMVAAEMVVVIINSAAAVDATATILSSALTVAAKTPLPPSIVTSINND